MAKVQCLRPLTYNGKRYKPGDIFDAEEKYLSELSNLCIPAIGQSVDQNDNDQSDKSKSKKGSK